MTGTSKGRNRLFGAVTLAICATLTLGMTSKAPLFLYPITPSLPPGLYIRTFEPPTIGTIAAFQAPEAARRYKASIGEHVHDDFLFMKPIAAAAGDHACNSRSRGLLVNGRLASHASLQDRGRELPFWHGCRRLLGKEYLVLSTHSRRSFDGRHFGPIDGDRVLGTYRPLIGQAAHRALTKTKMFRDRRIQVFEEDRLMKPDQQVRYIRARQLEEQYGIDRVTAWRWSRDRRKAFPKAIRLTPNVSVYDKAEVEAWFEERKMRAAQQ